MNLHGERRFLLVACRSQSTDGNQTQFIPLYYYSAVEKKKTLFESWKCFSQWKQSKHCQFFLFWFPFAVSISAILLKTNTQRELKAELLLGSWSGAWEKQDRTATADSAELET